LERSGGVHRLRRWRLASLAAGLAGVGDPYERALPSRTSRCLIGNDRANEALAPLNEARDLFAELGAAPALVEADTLPQDATALRG
jgi:hypothetical protein